MKTVDWGQVASFFLKRSFCSLQFVIVHNTLYSHLWFSFTMPNWCFQSFELVIPDLDNAKRWGEIFLWSRLEP